ncbi:hypothetical protein [Streptomyces sp. NPDC102476]
MPPPASLEATATPARPTQDYPDDIARLLATRRTAPPPAPH